MDANGCPADYEEWARAYFGMARSIVSRYPNVNPNDVDDLTQEILLKFVEKKFLAQYDPTKKFATPTGMRPARFATLFRSFVRKFLRTPVETRERKAAREPIRLEQPAPGGAMWIEVYGPREPTDPIGRVEFETEIRRAYRHLATIQVDEGDTDLGEVLVWMVDEAAPLYSTQRVIRREAAKAFGVSDTTITRWLATMRAELHAIGFNQEIDVPAPVTA